MASSNICIYQKLTKLRWVIQVYLALSFLLFSLCQYCPWNSQVSICIDDDYNSPRSNIHVYIRNRTKLRWTIQGHLAFLFHNSSLWQYCPWNSQVSACIDDDYNSPRSSIHVYIRNWRKLRWAIQGHLALLFLRSSLCQYCSWNSQVSACIDDDYNSPLRDIHVYIKK